MDPYHLLIGDILVAKGLIGEADIARALEHQKVNGGRLGDSLIALKLVTEEQIRDVLNQMPTAPAKLEEMDVSPRLLLILMIKGIYVENLELASQIANAMKLPSQVIETLLEQAVERGLVEVLGQTQSLFGGYGENRHALTQAGREAANEALEQNQYFGPAPVSLKSYVERVQRQRITTERLSPESIKEAFESLVIPERFLHRLGPAINSGTAILIYGPAGNGKTSIAEIIGHAFRNAVYIPYCFEVDGQIVKVFDPAVHRVVTKDEENKGESVTIQRDTFDKRWVLCHRPMVMAGGELTLEMLDLKFSQISKFYEAPLQVKALNGVFLIDDFGRQRVEPEAILNRWIVPLNSRVDYYNLHTGKNFQLPFDELLIFSSNLHPEELMDPAFLRRLTYKLETVAPSEELFRRVFEDLAKREKLELTDAIYKQVLDGIKAQGAPLAYYHPAFIVSQVLASCKFDGTAPAFTRENVEDAMCNLFVESAAEAMTTAGLTARAPKAKKPSAA